MARKRTGGSAAVSHHKLDVAPCLVLTGVVWQSDASNGSISRSIPSAYEQRVISARLSAVTWGASSQASKRI